MKEQIGTVHFLKSTIIFFYFSKLNFFLYICVANLFSRRREPEPEPGARPGAGADQSWTGSTTLHVPIVWAGAGVHDPVRHLPHLYCPLQAGQLVIYFELGFPISFGADRLILIRQIRRGSDRISMFLCVNNRHNTIATLTYSCQRVLLLGTVPVPVTTGLC